jgi:hypothetical protein
MHKSARFATTAGATVLTFAAMSGVAQADPVGDLTGGLTDTVGGVVNSATGGAVKVSRPEQPKAPSRNSTRSSEPTVGVGVDGPVHANAAVSANSSPETGTQVNASVNAGVRGAGGGDAISAGISAGVDTCGFAPEECGDTGTPPSPPSPGPGSPPPGTPPGDSMGPAGQGSLTPGAAQASAGGILPITGGPLGTLAGIGLAAVLTGSAVVAGSRYRAGRSSAE